MTPTPPLVEIVAKAMSDCTLFWRYNDWTDDRVIGQPIEICKWTCDHHSDCEVIARYAGEEAEGSDYLYRHIELERSKAAISAVKQAMLSDEAVEAAMEAYRTHIRFVTNPDTKYLKSTAKEAMQSAITAAIQAAGETK